MPTTQQIQDQIQQMFGGRIAELQQSQARAQAALKGGWGGSAGQMQTWQSVANDTANQLQQLQQLHAGLKNQYGTATLSQEDLPLVQKAVGLGATDVQGLNELMRSRAQIGQQEQQLQAFRNKFETQEFGAPGATLQQALSSNTGDIGQLNQFLGQQQAQTFNTQLKPLIQQALGAQGLGDFGGAQVELQSKALAQLEQQRQQSIMQAALGARGQAQGLERSDILGSIGAQQQALSNLSDIQRTGITMQFQRELEQQREQLARELSSRQGGSGLMGGLSGAMGGAMMGMAVGGPVGALAGAGLGGAMGAGAFGGGQQSYQGGQMLGQMGPSFFAANPPRYYRTNYEYPSGGGVVSR